MSKEFFNDYFAYVGETEAPLIYHRWCIITCIAAMLGRNVYLPFGHARIYPNMYVMLEGNPGTRKGTAMRPARNLLKEIGFNKLAPDRLSAERFIAEMQHLNTPEDIEGISFENLTFDKPSEIFVVAGEFQDFIGAANLNFVGLLTNLWDNLDEYKHPKLHGASVKVTAPTVSILGGVNQQSLAICMPTEAIGQGGTSRWIFVHGDPTGKQYTFPRTGEKTYRKLLVDKLQRICSISGEIIIRESARELFDKLYREYTPIEDFRFAYYNTRRFDHLLKTSIVICLMDETLELTEQHALEANTILHVTEQKMTRAFGEFGKAKNADVANKIVEFVKAYFKKKLQPATARQIYAEGQVSTDIHKWDEYIQILRSLEIGDKIQQKDIKGIKGYVPKMIVKNGWKKEMLLEGYLREEELL